MLKRLKGLAEKVPYCVGKWFTRVPFSWRLGGGYVRTRKECSCVKDGGDVDKERYAIEHFRKVFEYARETFPCYRELYEKAGVWGLEVKTLHDIVKIPTIDKAWVRENVSQFKGTYKLNTGGTSGNPMCFFADRNSWAREWAHMHWIWEQLGYDYRDVKLTLRGRSRGGLPLAYNLVHNEFIISPYIPVKLYKEKLISLCRQVRPQWIHGYPSVIYQFLLELEECASKSEIENVIGNIRGMFLSSEFPLPYIVKKFKQYGLRYVSWYGHSEMCILAFDLSGINGLGKFANRYHPFTTYGLCEVCDGRLIGSSFHNFEMPLIRYDTGDRVEATDFTEGGLVKEFSIKEGRNADFILDKNGKPFSVNSLIIGRHHHVCDVAEYIQIMQREPGEAVFLVTSKKDLTEPFDKLFDIPCMDMKFSMQRIPEPIRSAAGKLKMRVLPEEYDSKHGPTLISPEGSYQGE